MKEPIQKKVININFDKPLSDNILQYLMFGIFGLIAPLFLALFLFNFDIFNGWNTIKLVGISVVITIPAFILWIIITWHTTKLLYPIGTEKANVFVFEIKGFRYKKIVSLALVVQGVYGYCSLVLGRLLGVSFSEFVLIFYGLLMVRILILIIELLAYKKKHL